MSQQKSKRILGLLSICIMLHHLGQRISAPWVPALYRRHGLELFVPIGYLLVSFFFFCSGYGLIKSMRSKENYFKGFLVRRLNRILMIFVFTEIIWFIARTSRGVLGLPLNPYSWFIYAIISFYVGFFLIYRKENRFSFWLMAAWILAYTLICYLLVAGNWWYNAAPAFLLGIFIADHEPRRDTGTNADTAAADTVRPIGKTILISAVLCLLTFFLSENADRFYQAAGMHHYALLNLIKVLLQAVASCSFSLLLYTFAVRTGADTADTAGMSADSKGSRPRRILDFYGSMTLEFYLIHGLFVHLFSHHFIDDSTPPVLYIPNMPLNVLAVFALSTASAFGLKKLADLITAWYRRSEGLQRFLHSMKKAGIVLLAIAVVFTVFMGVRRAQRTRSAEAKYEEFRAENITMVNAGGREVAVYTGSSGTDGKAGGEAPAIVFFSSDSLPGATLHLKPLADLLAKDYRVIVIDYPGTGYSPDTDGERSADFYADLVKETLDEMGINDNIVIAAHLLSGLYAYRYIEKYPEGIRGFVGVDAVVPEVGPHYLGGGYSSVDEYKWYLDRYAGAERRSQEFLVRTGFIAAQMPFYEAMYPTKSMEPYIPVLEKIYVENYHRGAHLEEYRKAYDNCMAVMDFRLPENLPAMFLLSSYIRNANPYSVNWLTEYNRIITDKEKQYVSVMNGDPYRIYYDPKFMKQKIDEFLE
ncbi:MAG: acyltransferase family protein [Lachnospiraceae bacterium]|nr:acyltransferase family protein [Lachnospiraceae bacterium]